MDNTDVMQGKQLVKICAMNSVLILEKIYLFIDSLKLLNI